MECFYHVYPMSFPGISSGCRDVHVGACHGPVRKHIRGGQTENGHSSGVYPACSAHSDGRLLSGNGYLRNGYLRWSECRQ